MSQQRPKEARSPQAKGIAKALRRAFEEIPQRSSELDDLLKQIK